MLGVRRRDGDPDVVAVRDQGGGWEDFQVVAAGFAGDYRPYGVPAAGVVGPQDRAVLGVLAIHAHGAPLVAVRAQPMRAYLPDRARAGHPPHRRRWRGPTRHAGTVARRSDRSDAQARGGDSGWFTVFGRVLPARGQLVSPLAGRCPLGAVLGVYGLRGHADQQHGEQLGGDENLTGAGLGGATLTGAILYRGNLAHANLHRATLTSAFLYRANLTDATLDDANLAKADLSHAKLTDATLDDATLTEANLSGVDLTKAVGLRQSQLDSARGDEHTRLPAGLTRPTTWPAPEQGAPSSPPVGNPVIWHGRSKP